MTESHQGKPRVLVVDDEASVRASIRLILDGQFAVFEAASGTEALDVLAREQIDVVTLDLRMPGLGGPETLREIRRRNHAVNVLVVSAMESPRDVEEAERHDVFAWVRKPFAAAPLHEAVTRAAATPHEDRRRRERDSVPPGVTAACADQHGFAVIVVVRNVSTDGVAIEVDERSDPLAVEFLSRARSAGSLLTLIGRSFESPRGVELRWQVTAGQKIRFGGLFL